MKLAVDTDCNVEQTNALNCWSLFGSNPAGSEPHEIGASDVTSETAASDTTTAFDARRNGKALEFQAAGGDADRLVDTGTHSTWNAYGLCVSGKLKGTQLKPLVMEPEFWFAWSEFHPDTAIYGTARSGAR